jgi:hypothetical protein
MTLPCGPRSGLVTSSATPPQNTNSKPTNSKATLTGKSEVRGDRRPTTALAIATLAPREQQFTHSLSRQGATSSRYRFASSRDRNDTSATTLPSRRPSRLERRSGVGSPSSGPTQIRRCSAHQQPRSDRQAATGQQSKPTVVGQTVRGPKRTTRQPESKSAHQLSPIGRFRGQGVKVSKSRAERKPINLPSSVTGMCLT